MPFVAQCPYCPALLRLPDAALGASIPCPKCQNSFTAVPRERGGVSGAQSVGALARRPHLAPGLSFNFLAFLSDVRKVIAAGDPTARRRAS